MPLYSFHCPGCEAEFDAQLDSSDAPAPPCPSCGGTSVSRMPAAPAIGGRLKSGLQAARKQAAKEGHFSNYSARETKGKL